MIVREYKHENKVVEICVDEDPVNPRDDMACIGTLWCWHRNYQLGSKKEAQTKGFNPSDYSGWEELRKAVEKEALPAVILPVYMFDHGGIALSTGSFSCRWDSGQVGFIFATRAQALEAFGAKKMTKRVRARVEEALRQEVATYSAYANGEVYGFRVLDEMGEVLDSCYGFYGADEIPYMLECALGAEGAKSAEEIR